MSVVIAACPRKPSNDRILLSLTSSVVSDVNDVAPCSA
jgi:hypothetical protein